MSHTPSYVQFLLFSTAFHKQLFILQVIKKLNILVTINEWKGRGAVKGKRSLWTFLSEVFVTQLNPKQK